MYDSIDLKVVFIIVKCVLNKEIGFEIFSFRMPHLRVNVIGGTINSLIKVQQSVRRLNDKFKVSLVSLHGVIHSDMKVHFII